MTPPRDYGLTEEQAAQWAADGRARYLAHLVAAGSPAGIAVAAGLCPCGTHPLTTCHYCDGPVPVDGSADGLTEWVNCGCTHDDDEEDGE